MSDTSARVTHDPTNALGWYLFALLPSGCDELVADHMIAEGIYGRPYYFGGAADAE